MLPDLVWAEVKEQGDVDAGGVVKPGCAVFWSSVLYTGRAALQLTCG